MIQEIELNQNNFGIQKYSEGIEILVNMARSGKVDPWNIDIVDITDKYLAHLIEMKTNNLKLTGKTLLFAAILLRLKSNVLEGLEVMDTEEEELLEDDYETESFDDFEDEEEVLNKNNLISINDVLQRRTSVRLNRNRVVTLKDLIKQLEFYEQLENKRTLKNAHERAKRRVRSYANLTPDDIINLAHDEYIENSIQKLKQNLEVIFQEERKVGLTELALLGLDKISAYIALLFISANSDYELVQDEFYSELYVVKEGDIR